MPRVRAPAPGAKATATTASPVKTVQIALNDDKQEKAARLQSRQIAHTKTLESYKSAVSPAKRNRNRNRNSLGNSTGPSTPQQSQDGGEYDEYNPAGTAVTPMKRVPILANFEEWMKMATDNKINATNSWSFALIDYFHDMSLLKEQDGKTVNFQKASCTLDGCVKIYTSRVDSVATETGKLLSGLAESRDKKARKGGEGEGEGEEGGEDEEEGEDGEGGGKKKRKAKQRSAEATLVNSFEQLRLKKMELEFSVDPLFKKASADFDEGGAKGLLLNHLSIDGEGRIVFDSSDDSNDTTDESRRDSLDPEGLENDSQTKESADEPAQEDGPIDISALASKFFPDLTKLETQSICPSLQTFELGVGDASLDLPFLKAPENWRDEHPETLHAESGAEDDADNDAMMPAFDADDEDNGIPFDIPPDTAFGEGGEAWARDAALQPQMRVHDIYSAGGDGEGEGGEVGTFDANSNAYGVTIQHRSGEFDQENILNYFDAALRKNWAGPEHWKITRVKEAAKAAAGQGEKKVRKEKEPFEIDFLAPMTEELAGLLYTEASTAAQISLPKKERRSRTRNLLPDDKHFHSADLLKLFLKPKARMGARRATSHHTRPLAEGEEVDEAYWAQHNARQGAEDGDGGVQGDYDANFFNDDNLPLPAGMDPDEDDGLEFADAREHLSPGIVDEVDAAGGGGPEGPGIDAVMAGAEGGNGDFGANLVAQSRRLRPEYVQYARVAKKVDVRRLKLEMWKGIGFEGVNPQQQPPQTPSRPPIPTLSKSPDETLHFVDIMNNLQHIYPKQQMADISTSYGFICLLHLANEKGLVIENVEGWRDLTVRKDFEAVDLDAGN